jgi:hypothetical protein
MPLHLAELVVEETLQLIEEGRRLQGRVFVFSSHSHTYVRLVVDSSTEEASLVAKSLFVKWIERDAALEQSMHL